jgi:hypothetical protein
VQSRFAENRRLHKKALRDPAIAKLIKERDHALLAGKQTAAAAEVTALRDRIAELEAVAALSAATAAAPAPAPRKK